MVNANKKSIRITHISFASW